MVYGVVPYIDSRRSGPRALSIHFTIEVRMSDSHCEEIGSIEKMFALSRLLLRLSMPRDRVMEES